MIESVHIKKHKKIKNVTIESLVDVNYLVGENSSGKTSVLESIFLYFSGEKRFPQFEKSETTIIKKPNEYVCHYITNNNYVLGKYKLFNKNKDLDNLGYNTNENLDDRINEYFNIDLVNSSFDGYSSQIDLPSDLKKYLINVANIFDISIKKIEKKVAVPELGEQNLQLKVTNNENKTFPINFYAGGYIYLLKLSLAILVKIKKHFGDKKANLILLIEEPEAQLNPKIQKKLPELFNFLIKIFKENNKSEESSLQFIISTHSPFVISKIKDQENQKVYLLSNGNLIDLSGNIINKSAGFLDRQSLIISGKMLGFETGDVGYPENFCILEESSLVVILDNCVKKGFIKEIQFVSAGGWTRTAKFYDDILRLKTLLSCNPFYYDKFLIVTDLISKNDKKLSAYKKIANLKERYIELKKCSIEEYYVNLDLDMYNEYLKYKSNIITGEQKLKLAKSISEKIHSIEDFKTLFNNELNTFIN